MLLNLCARSIYWWSNAGGNLLEILGAALIVWSAFQTRSKIKSEPDSWDNELSVKLRDIVATQAYTELTGFLLLALGLVGQLIGTLE